MFSFLRKKISGIVKEVRKAFVGVSEKVTKVELSESAFDKFFSPLESALLEGGVALSVVEKIKGDLKSALVGNAVERKKLTNFVKEKLSDSLLALLSEHDFLGAVKEGKRPFVIVFFGVNGSGKTTTLAKVGSLLQRAGFSCVFAASDTFRAASIEQLNALARELKVRVITHSYGSDAAAVAFDAIAYARASGTDVVLIDTAGRMHTEANLMAEMKKICKVAAPDLRVFVGDATTGNDAVEQAREFADSVGIDCSILTKADVDEKAGSLLSVAYVTKKPLAFLGIGQGLNDLKVFNKKEFVDKLLC